MYKHGHIGAALLAYSPLALVVTALGSEEFAFLGAVVAVGLAMLPDIDQRIPFVQHRGATHTVHFAAVVAVLLGLLGVLVGLEGGLLGGVTVGLFGFLTGALTVGSHLLADMLTPAGVDVFANGDRVSYDVVRASNPIANYLLLGIGTTVAFFAAAVGGQIAAFTL